MRIDQPSTQLTDRPPTPASTARSNDAQQRFNASLNLNSAMPEAKTNTNTNTNTSNLLRDLLSQRASTLTEFSAPPPPGSRTPQPIRQDTAASPTPTPTPTPTTQSAGNDPVAEQFRQQFADQAANKDGFHRLMNTVYGDSYSPAQAEQLRQKALQGDFSWLPEVRYVNSAALGGANGAYDQHAGTVYINEDLKGSALAAQTFVEEAGHHVDTLVNRGDAAGDEGELLRRLLGGEHLSSEQVQQIRSENDKGTIHIDGRDIEVEFWNPIKAIKKAASAVVDGVTDVVKGVGNAVKTAAEGVVDMTVGVVKNVGEGIVEFGTNLFQGNVGDAFGALGDGLLGAGRSLLDGLDQTLLQAPQTLVSGTWNGLQHGFNAATELLPGGEYLREVSDRVFDGGRSLLQAGFGITRDLFRAPTELVLDFAGDLTQSLEHLLKGEFKQAAVEFGSSFVNLGVGTLGRGTDVAIRALHAGADIVGMALGQPASRELSDPEEAYLRQIYGDSLDYSLIRVREGGITDAFGMTAHVVGNTIYMPEKYFDANGDFTADGLETLGHEGGHIWQNQNGGGDYMHKALLAQLAATIDGGDRSGAYNWIGAMRAGIAFEDMNPEQQASVAEDIGGALVADGVVDRSDFPNLNDTEFDFLMNAWKMIRAGEGAP